MFFCPPCRPPCRRAFSRAWTSPSAEHSTASALSWLSGLSQTLHIELISRLAKLWLPLFPSAPDPCRFDRWLLPPPLRIRIFGIKTMPILTWILTPSLTHMGRIWIFSPFNHSIATLQCFIILISVKCVLIFCTLDTGQHIEIFWKTVLLYQLFHMLRIDTDPDPSKLMRTRPDPDPDLQHCKNLTKKVLL